MTDEAFVKLIQACRMDDQKLGDLLGVSRTAIRRWKIGQNLPHWMMRGAIRETVEALK